MRRLSLNQLWILLLATCLMAGAATTITSVAHAVDGIGIAGDGTDDRQPGFGPPPTATGDPDWPIVHGLSAPRPQSGPRGSTLGWRSTGPLAAQNSRLPANELWSLRFQILLRAWLTYLAR